MTSEALIQGSEEWIAARVGSLGASRLHDAIARTKMGWGASRTNILADLLAERLTRQPTPTFVTAAMQRGKDLEADARAAYEYYADIDVVQVGLIAHPKIKGTHASPDGLVGDDGLVEIKVPLTAQHLDLLLGQAIPGKYIIQMQWQMACTGRKWCDFVCYSDVLPESMRLWIKRVERDANHISELEKLVTEFLRELDAKIAALNAKYVVREAA